MLEGFRVLPAVRDAHVARGCRGISILDGNGEGWEGFVLFGTLSHVRAALCRSALEV